MSYRRCGVLVLEHRTYRVRFVQRIAGQLNGRSPAAVERRTKATTESIESTVSLSIASNSVELSVSLQILKRRFHLIKSISSSTPLHSFFINRSSPLLIKFFQRFFIKRFSGIKATHSIKATLHSSSLHSSSRRRILHQGDAITLHSSSNASAASRRRILSRRRFILHRFILHQGVIGYDFRLDIY